MMFLRRHVQCGVQQTRCAEPLWRNIHAVSGLPNAMFVCWYRWSAGHWLIQPVPQRTPLLKLHVMTTHSWHYPSS